MRYKRSVHLLVVEDDPRLGRLLSRLFANDRHVVDLATGGQEAIELVAANPGFDAVVLDVGLPGINGFDVARRLRETGSRIPILMLTARDGVDDRIAGLDTGADDYLVKPFDFGELLARIRAVSRRGPVDQGTVLEVGDLTFDTGTHTVRRGEVDIPLSVKELQLLEALMRRPGQVLSRFDLLERAWDMDYENRSNVVDVYIRYLREKVDRPFGVESIETVRGAGYRLRAVRTQV